MSLAGGSVRLLRSDTVSDMVVAAFRRPDVGDDHLEVL